jgi:hypothetical protein
MAKVKQKVKHFAKIWGFRGFSPNQSASEVGDVSDAYLAVDWE